MTEKRSDYRKQIKRKKNSGLLHTIKSAFDDSDEAVDVNPDFMRESEEKEQVAPKAAARSKRKGSITLLVNLVCELMRKRAKSRILTRPCF